MNKLNVMNSITKTLKKHPAAAVFLLVSAVFVVLYRRFLFGGFVYLYSDVGSDSIASSYPILTQMAFLFQNRTFTFYTLSSGLGQETAATFLQFLNPLKFFMLFFDNDHMIDAILIQLYLQAAVSGLAFYHYIRRFTKGSPAAVLASVIWPFTSYTVLWSQNLSYGTAVCMFTVTICLMEDLLDRRSLKNALLLSLCLAFFISANYYFVYMTAVFTVFYIPLRALFLKKKLRELFRGLLDVLLSGLFSAALSAAAIVCILSNFTNSSRTQDAGSFLSHLTDRIQPSLIYASFAGLFSENMLGTGGDFSVSGTDYYETALIFVSALFLISFFYLIQAKSRRKPLLTVTVLSAVSLIFPAARFLLNQNTVCMRFSFFICFFECIAIALFLDDLFSLPDRARLKKAVFSSLLFTALSFAVLYFLQAEAGASLNRRAVLFSLFSTLCCACIVLYAGRKNVPRRTAFLLVMLFLAGETVLMHHDSLYLRLYLTEDSFSTGFYNSGTGEAVDEIEKDDPDVFRIVSTEDINLSNEGEVHHFNATTLRNNTNPQSLIDLADAFGTNERYEPYFMCGYPQYFQFTLLSGKYVLENETRTLTDTAENTFFTKYGTFDAPGDGNTKTVYENKNALPFGYLYKYRISASDYKKLDLPDRMDALTECWFDSDAYTGHSLSGEEEEETHLSESGQNEDETGDADTADDSGFSDEEKDRTTISSAELENLSADDTRTDLLAEAVFRDPKDLAVSIDSEGLHLSSSGDDAYCYVDLPESVISAEQSSACYLYVRSDTEHLSPYQLQLYYLDEDHEEALPDRFTKLNFDKSFPDTLILLPEGITGFRLDFDFSEEQTVTDMELIICTNPDTHFEDLKDTDVSGITFADDRYSANVVSDTDEGMFCVPLLYSRNWSATVNGEPVRIRNINGGLIGIPLSKGTWDIELRYEIPHFRAALVLSLAAIALWIALFVHSIRREKHRFTRS